MIVAFYRIFGAKIQIIEKNVTLLTMDLCERKRISNNRRLRRRETMFTSDILPKKNRFLLETESKSNQDLSMKLEYVNIPPILTAVFFLQNMYNLSAFPCGQ